MNISESKLIRIVDYLSQLGHFPVKVRNDQYWYLSPLREEKTPSFKVDDRKNLWHDFGIGDGGDLIELGKYLYHTSNVSTVLSRLDGTSGARSMYVRYPHVPQKDITNGIIVEEIKPLQNIALLSYISSREINTDIAKKFCKEIYYRWSNRKYFGICFCNQSGGYEIRNAYFKGCIKSKDVTIIMHEQEERQQHICLFEGFMDFLSYLTMLRNVNQTICIQHPSDFIILNSVNNIKKCLTNLEGYPHIHCYLDNDQAGIKTVETIAGLYDVYVTDESFRYREYKDLNDCLRGKLR